jgi:hypothetical protein
MPIVVQNGNRKRVIRSARYRDERELESALATHPELLRDERDGEPALAMVQRQVQLPEAGPLDILFVDGNGYPVAVEVKLERNSGSRRDVVAQAFDYVSDLANVTIDELDRQTGGAIERALRSFGPGDGNAADTQFDALWQKCATSLRSGRVRLVIAVDDAPEGLIRIVQFVNDHSDLDVRLVAVKKHPDDEDGVIFVPSTYVHGGKKASPPAAEYKRLDDVSVAYDAIASPEFPIRGMRRSWYRSIRRGTWPSGLHYEFQYYGRGNEIGVDLHIDDDRLKPMAKLLRRLMPSVKRAFPGSRAMFDPSGSNERGAIRMRFGEGFAPQHVADVMRRFIEMTHEQVEKELDGLNLRRR